MLESCFLVDEIERNSRSQISRLFHSRDFDGLREFYRFEYFGVRHEFDGCTYFITFTYFLDLSVSYSSLISLEIFFPIFVDRDFEPFAQCIDDRSANSMQTSRDFIRAFIEFTSCVEDSEDCFESGFSCFFVFIYRDSSSIVMNSDGSVFVQCGRDSGTKSCQRFIDGIIYDFLDEMM